MSTLVLTSKWLFIDPLPPGTGTHGTAPSKSLSHRQIISYAPYLYYPQNGVLNCWKTDGNRWLHDWFLEEGAVLLVSVVSSAPPSLRSSAPHLSQVAVQHLKNCLPFWHMLVAPQPRSFGVNDTLGLSQRSRLCSSRINKPSSLWIDWYQFQKVYDPSLFWGLLGN